MQSQIYDSRTADRMNVRFPDGMREKIKQQARQNARTMNAEIVFQLAKAYSDESGNEKGPVTA